MGKWLQVEFDLILVGCVFQELARERQENVRLLKAHQDKDDLIGKLKEEIDLLNRVSPVGLEEAPHHHLHQQTSAARVSWLPEVDAT